MSACCNSGLMRGGIRRRASVDPIPEELPIVEFAEASGDSSHGSTANPVSIDVTVVRTGNLDAASTLNWGLSTISSPAESSDFQESAGQVVFAIGESEQTITITKITGDNAAWSPATIEVIITGAVGATVGDLDTYEHQYNFLS